jgi:hypothetical protein
MIRRTLLASALPVATVPAIAPAARPVPPTAETLRELVATYRAALAAFDLHSTRRPDAPLTVHKAHQRENHALCGAWCKARRRLARGIRLLCGSMPAAVLLDGQVIATDWDPTKDDRAYMLTVVPAASVARL